MNWDAIGAVGEIVGALTVLITLIYLAIQIRQSNRIAITASEADFRNLAQDCLSLVEIYCNFRIHMRTIFLYY